MEIVEQFIDDEESNIDVVEIDAASRTGVADVREIIENVGIEASKLQKSFYNR